MLSGEASQRDGQIESQRDIAVAVVAEAKQLLVGLVSTFSEQNLRVLQRGRVDRREAVAAIDLPCSVDQLFASDHRVRQVVAETFESRRLDDRARHNSWHTRLACKSEGPIRGGRKTGERPVLRDNVQDRQAEFFVPPVILARGTCGRNASANSTICSGHSKSMSYCPSPSYSQLSVVYSRQICGRSW